MFAPPVANGKNRPTTLASSQFGGSGKSSLLNVCLFSCLEGNVTDYFCHNCAFHEFKVVFFIAVEVFGPVAKRSLLSTEEENMLLLVFLNPLFYEYTVVYPESKLGAFWIPLNWLFCWSTYCTNLYIIKTLLGQEEGLISCVAVRNKGWVQKIWTAQISLLVKKYVFFFVSVFVIFFFITSCTPHTYVLFLLPLLAGFAPVKIVSQAVKGMNVPCVSLQVFPACLSVCLPIDTPDITLE